MLKKSCKVSTTLRNTGVDCDINMGATAMLLAVPRTFKFGATEIASGFSDFIQALIHGAAGTRVYPIFGNAAPIRQINNNKEADVVATLDDGVQIFVRYGFLNRIFSTTTGGLCYAKALQSFNSAGMRILEFDKQSHMLARDNGDGTYGGVRTDFMFAPSPDPADFRNPWKTHFQVSFDPQEYVGKGDIFTLGDEEASVVDMMGLLDVRLVLVSATTTVITLRVLSDCSEDNLVNILGDDLDVGANWIVTDKATGTVVPVTAAIAGDTLKLTGTFVTGHTYIIKGAPADVWYDDGEGIEGYDFESIPLEVKIP